MKDVQLSLLAVRAALDAVDAAVKDVETREVRVRLTARQVLRLYRQRQRAFATYPGTVADPSWVMLLDLFVQEPGTVSVTSACLASQVAPTTALRHVVGLVNVGLVERLPCATDRRRHFLQLTAAGASVVQASLA